MAPYAAPTLLYGTGAGYVGSMAGLSDEMMIDFSETMLYALSFSNILVKGSDMVESTTGKNALKDALGEDAYRIVGQVSEAGAAVTVIAGLYNPAYGVKNNQVAHFEQVPRAGEGGKASNYGIDMGNLNFSNTVQNHIGRPYQESKLLINEIIESKPPVPDTRGTNALSWIVEGTFNGSTGYYELIIDPASNTVWHFVFKSQ